MAHTAAIYIRVSSETQRDNTSREKQRDKGLEYAASKQFIVWTELSIFLRTFWAAMNWRRGRGTRKPAHGCSQGRGTACPLR